MVSKLDSNPLRQRFLKTVVLDIDDPKVTFLFDEGRRPWLVNYEGNWYMFDIVWEKVIVRDVTMQMQRQYKLIHLMIIGMIIAWLLSYLFSKWFVMHALRDLHALADKVENLHIDNMSMEVDFSHLPEHDELRTIADSLQEMSQSLHNQIDAMKSFVRNASHELRTPLMILRSWQELAHKTKNYEWLVEKQLATISRMEWLITSLLSLARTDQHTLTKTQLFPEQFIQDMVNVLKEKYEEKDITVITELDPISTIQADRAWVERMIHNLVDNAFKYTDTWWTITIVATDKQCSISDTWQGMSKEHLQHIRDPFWQADQSKWVDSWFGLWLALVKRLVELHGREIAVESERWRWTRFTLYWS